MSLNWLLQSLNLKTVNKMNKTTERELRTWAVTGTYHGSLVIASSEGRARAEFHREWNGESIIHIKLLNYSGTLS